ncbi:hypothetical protein Pan216_16210 [Planctomycetes bacterium Pan216]|uniref:Uncharacterized protein n=1 Tax=Kolteria novifilia TaxID=2527975 RepID=A0A518B1B3_9BACT|nr:hypothetical protein Pan216_16210 [Planctomycetes bacterium Pan216]
MDDKTSKRSEATLFHYWAVAGRSLVGSAKCLEAAMHAGGLLDGVDYNKRTADTARRRNEKDQWGHEVAPRYASTAHELRKGAEEGLKRLIEEAEFVDRTIHEFEGIERFHPIFAGVSDQPRTVFGNTAPSAHEAVHRFVDEVINIVNTGLDDLERGELRTLYCLTLDREYPEESTVRHIAAWLELEFRKVGAQYGVDPFHCSYEDLITFPRVQVEPLRPPAQTYETKESETLLAPIIEKLTRTEGKIVATFMEQERGLRASSIDLIKKVWPKRVYNPNTANLLDKHLSAIRDKIKQEASDLTLARDRDYIILKKQ